MGGKSKKQTVGYRYRMGLHMVLCHGPVDAVQKIQVGDRTAWGDASRATLPLGHGLGRLHINAPRLFGGDEREGGVEGDLDVLAGEATQGRNDYLQSQLGAAIPAFRGVLSLVARKMLLASNNPYIKPWAVRVRRIQRGWHPDRDWASGSAQVNVWDDASGQWQLVGMNPAHILVQCLTDPQWGMGYPLDMIGDTFMMSAWRLQDEGFGLNLIWTRQQPIESFIAQVLEHIGGVIYTDPETGQFELRLLRDDYSVSELEWLGPDQIIQVERFERAQWGELPNEITVVYTDWQTGREATVSVQNLAAIQLQGGVINQRRDYPGVNYGPLAARLAVRDLRALGTPLARLRLVVASGSLSRIPRPGDVLRLHWPRLGIAQMVIRVTGIDTGMLGDGRWQLEAVEDVWGLDQHVLTQPPAPPPVTSEPPHAPALVLAVEAPYWELARRLSRADLAALTDTDTLVGALAAAGGPGQHNWALMTGPTAADLDEGPVEDYAPLLQLAAALPGTEADALAVPVTLIRNPERLAVGDYAYLVDASGALREAVEVLAFDPVAGTIDLARGVLDTTPQAQPAGTRLIGVGEWLASEGAERAPGESVFVAATPRTMTAQGVPTLAGNGQPMVLVGRQARPYPPGRVRLNGAADPAVVAGDLTITWAHRDRTLQTAYLVHQDEADIGPEPGTTYTVRVRDAGGTVVRTVSGLAGTSWTWDVATAASDAGAAGGQVTIELWASRGGLDSWQPQTRTVERAGYGLRYGQSYGGL